MKKIVFFSSDARPLYKEDIYRCLALPNKYIIHFRYQRKYIDDCLLTSLRESPEFLNSKEAVVFFTANNNLHTEMNNKETKNISIREVKIVSSEESSNTELCHFYLELGDFKEYTIKSNTFTPMKFVSELELILESKHSWVQRVNAVKDFFEEGIFINIKHITDKNNNTKPIAYYSNKKASKCQLNDNNRYSLNISIYEKKGNKAFVKLTNSTGAVFTMSESKLRAHALLDDESIPIIVKTIDCPETTDILKFIVCNETKESCETNVELNIKRSKLRLLIFGLASSVLLFCASALTFFSTKHNSYIYFVYFILIIFAGISLTVLYNIFNKK